MHALPALVLATDAVRAQFAMSGAPEPERAVARSRSGRYRVVLAHLLERAARAVAPAEHSPAH